VTLTAWRITKREHTRNAFTGEGAREFGGRWNHPGTAVVYTAQSQSLAALLCAALATDISGAWEFTAETA